MDNNQIIISKNTLFKGEISAASITIEGKVIGNLTATTSILINEHGWVEGHICAPKIYLAKGCHHEGNIYLDNLENASSAKITMNRLKFKSNELKANEYERPKEQPITDRTENNFW